MQMIANLPAARGEGAPSESSARGELPQLPGWGRAALNRPWEIITPICRSMNTAERRLENTCLGILPYLYLACCLTNGIQLNVPALRTGRTRKPRSLDLFFFLVMTSFLEGNYSKLGAQRQALKLSFISSHRDIKHPGPSLTLSFFLYWIEMTGTYNTTTH